MIPQRIPFMSTTEKERMDWTGGTGLNGRERREWTGHEGQDRMVIRAPHRHNSIGENGHDRDRKEWS